jgi:hypothetical protein
MKQTELWICDVCHRANARGLKPEHVKEIPEWNLCPGCYVAIKDAIVTVREYDRRPRWSLRAARRQRRKGSILSSMLT